MTPTSVATSAPDEAGSGATIAAADRRTRQSEVLGAGGYVPPDSDPRSVEKRSKFRNRWVWSWLLEAERPWPYHPHSRRQSVFLSERGGMSRRDAGAFGSIACSLFIHRALWRSIWGNLHSREQPALARAGCRYARMRVGAGQNNMRPQPERIVTH